MVRPFVKYRDRAAPIDTVIAKTLTTTTAPGELRFVGRQTCAPCHPREDERWRGSHHDLAMQVADEKTVLSNFNDRTFTYRGITSRFFRRDGQLRDYEIAYTFGAMPLQQYLVAFPGGRYQALGIA